MFSLMVIKKSLAPRNLFSVSCQIKFLVNKKVVDYVDPLNGNYYLHFILQARLFERISKIENKSQIEAGFLVSGTKNYEILANPIC
jgi:hypothetical protein